jgi:hypothetical protein
VNQLTSSSDATLAGNSNIAVPTEAAVKTYVDSSKMSTVFSSANSTLNASGQLTAAINNGVTYTNITYNAGGYISSYKEAVGLTTKLISITYDTNNFITAVTSVAA